MPALGIASKSKAGDNRGEVIVRGENRLMRYVAKRSEGTKKERKQASMVIRPQQNPYYLQ